jgi:predicted XRE-type DNA-binding protein
MADGFRSTVSTMLNESGFRSHVIEWQLAHQERNNVRASRNHATKLAREDYEARYEAAKDRIERGTENSFADNGYADAKERQTKLRLALSINQIIEQRKLTQSQGGQCVGLPQQNVSLLSRYKVEGFSVERLMNFLLRHEQPQWLAARYWQNRHDLHRFTGKDRVVRMVFEQLGSCLV